MKPILSSRAFAHSVFSDICLIMCKLGLIIVQVHNSVAFNAFKLNKYFLSPSLLHHYTQTGRAEDSLATVSL